MMNCYKQPLLFLIFSHSAKSFTLSLLYLLSLKKDIIIFRIFSIAVSYRIGL